MPGEVYVFSCIMAILKRPEKKQWKAEKQCDSEDGCTQPDILSR
jgi:hypothetical protein